MVSDSLSRKLTLLTIPPFMVGWAFYVVGLVSELNVAHTELTHPSGVTTSFSPFYISLIGGPLLIKIGLLHAALSGVGSGIFGAILTLLSTIYFSSAGAVTFTCTAIISDTKSMTSQSQDKATKPNMTNIELILMGLTLQGITWCFMLVLSNSFVYQAEEERCIVNHSPTSDTRQLLAPRIARTLSTLFLLVAMMSWCVFSSGLYRMSKEEEADNKLTSFFTSVTLALIHLLALMNMGSTDKKMTIAMSITTMIYLYMLGERVNMATIARHKCDQLLQFCTEEYINAANRVVVGGVVNLVFWGCSFALQPFYRKHHPTTQIKRYIIR